MNISQIVKNYVACHISMETSQSVETIKIILELEYSNFVGQNSHARLGQPLVLLGLTSMTATNQHSLYGNQKEPNTSRQDPQKPHGGHETHPNTHLSQKTHKKFVVETHINVVNNKKQLMPEISNSRLIRQPNRIQNKMENKLNKYEISPTFCSSLNSTYMLLFNISLHSSPKKFIIPPRRVICELQKICECKGGFMGTHQI